MSLIAVTRDTEAQWRPPGDARCRLDGPRPKLLIVSWYFPPANTIGAVRVGKLAKFLDESGADFRVLTASRWGFPETLPLEVPLERIVGTPWTDINELPRTLRAAFGLRRQATAPAPPSSEPAPRLRRGVIGRA